jgi:ADP-ribose pyrophosphatase
MTMSDGEHGVAPPDWERVRTDPLHAYSVFRTRREHVRSPRDGSVHRFDIVESDDAVTVVPITAAGDFVMIEQYRQGTRRITLELPGGMLDEGETWAACAARELREETGFGGREGEHLGTLEANPGWQTSRVHVIRIRDAAPAGAKHLDGGEDTRVRLVPRREALRLVLDGGFNAAGSVAALAMHIWREEADAAGATRGEEPSVDTERER